MNILLTGAGGFVGGAVWQRLRQRGTAVLATGRRPVADADDHYFVHDLRRPLPALPRTFHPDVIIHAAARSSPWGPRAAFIADNIDATRHVLALATRHGSPHVIHVSTAAVLYTTADQPDLAETAPLADPPINAYAATKQVAEALVAAYDGPWTILRPRAVFGPGDTVLFPRILRAARRGRLPRILARTPVRADLIYIDVLVDYILRVADTGRTGLFHLSNAEPVELWPFLDDVLQRLDLPVPRRSIPARRLQLLATVLEALHRLLPWLGEPPLTRFGVGVFASTKTLNVQKALADLGPPSVDLATGVARFVTWQRQQP